MFRRVACQVWSPDSVQVRNPALSPWARSITLPFSFLACLFLVHPSYGGEEAGCCNGAYVAVVAGVAESSNRVVDTEGFAHWGMPGWTTKFNDNSSMLGLRIGRILDRPDRKVRLEFGLNFTDARSSSNLLDPRIPVGLDETAVSEPKWIATAQVGLDHDIGQLTLFALGGLAAGRVHNSVTDLDWVRDANNLWVQRVDPDDSFSSVKTKFGWSATVGLESQIGNRTSVRFELMHVDLGSSRHYVNLSGDGACGRGGPNAPCPLKYDNEFTSFGVGLVFHLGSS